MTCVGTEIRATANLQTLTHHKYSRTMEAHKVLIQMSGAPGSGKSTLAKLLAQHSSINGVVIDHDLIKSCLLDNGITFQKSAEITYSLQWILASDMLRQGRNVIVDSTCNYQETLDQGTALARQHGYEYAYIECVMSISDIGLLCQRLRDRVALRSQRTSVDTEPRDVDGPNSSSCGNALERYKTWIESPMRPANGSFISVDATGSPTECLRSALKQMRLSAEALSSTPTENSSGGSL